MEEASELFYYYHPIATYGIHGIKCEICDAYMDMVSWENLEQDKMMED